MHIERERDGRIAQFTHTIHRVESSRHTNLIDSLAKTTHIADDIHIAGPGLLCHGHGALLQVEGFLKLRLQFGYAGTQFLTDGIRTCTRHFSTTLVNLLTNLRFPFLGIFQGLFVLALRLALFLFLLPFFFFQTGNPVTKLYLAKFQRDILSVQTHTQVIEHVVGQYKYLFKAFFQSHTKRPLDDFVALLIEIGGEMPFPGTVGSELIIYVRKHNAEVVIPIRVQPDILHVLAHSIQLTFITKHSQVLSIPTAFPHAHIAHILVFGELSADGVQYIPFGYIGGHG